MHSVLEPMQINVSIPAKGLIETIHSQGALPCTLRAPVLLLFFLEFVTAFGTSDLFRFALPESRDNVIKIDFSENIDDEPSPHTVNGEKFDAPLSNSLLKIFHSFFS